MADSLPRLQGKRAIVVGLGASGRSALELLVAHGASVTGTDKAQADGLPSSLRSLPIELVTGGHEGVAWEQADLVVLSPGVPPFAELARAAKAGAEVIGEVELASRFLEGPLLAVGGTNGKSTATTLLGHLVEAAGHRAFVGANLGEPACDAPQQSPDVTIFEVSSFQMERVPTFRPNVAVLLNITEDHLDRYPSFAEYAWAKGNCFQNQTQNDVAIAPVDDELALAQAQRGNGRLVTFGDGGDYSVDGSDVVEKRTGERFSLEGADLHGRHNHLNAAAAIAAARAFGISAEDVAEGLRRFRALPHRMGLSGRVRGVSFYDDSKATNVGAAVTALRGLTEDKGVLVAGGRDKLGSYDSLVAALADKGRAVILMGEAADRLAEAIGDVVPVERARGMTDAVQRAFRRARPGDAVLLSPACSSLDMFKNYSERGDRFTEAVQALARSMGKEEG
ncbi:MAG TPA: UDP-N-acetylmuramoyl-L-alanine--D-glutamate ligase [Polyangiaceae bacterium]|nr:UDP-N-acetylmuramoyl-L-alanine--D-glutamate ligase [Polyangiaceae bacterium]